MKELYKDILQKAIDNLPEMDPKPYLWSDIESFLDFDQRISEATTSLPTYEPEERLWSGILFRLESVRPKIFSLSKSARYSIAAAAALLVFFFARQILFPGHKESVYISYSTAKKILADSLPTPAKTEQDSEKFIRMSCSMKPGRCESPEISALEYELENLNNQYKILNEEAQHYGNDESIMKAYAKIEMTKSRIVKELVEKLNS